MRLQYRETGEKAKIAIWLDNSRKTEMKAFHCPVCGFVAFTYYDNTKIMVPGEGPIEPDTKPVIVNQCKNNQCKTQFLIYK